MAAYNEFEAKLSHILRHHFRCGGRERWRYIHIYLLHGMIAALGDLKILTLSFIYFIIVTYQRLLQHINSLSIVLLFLCWSLMWVWNWLHFFWWSSVFTSRVAGCLWAIQQYDYSISKDETSKSFLMSWRVKWNPICMVIKEKPDKSR